jgi:hypothetical protein
MEGIAVDNDPASPAYHAVYVFDNENHRVQRFTLSGEFVWMVGGDVNKTTSGNLCTAASGDTCGAGTASDAEGHFNSIRFGGIAVGPGGVLYVADRVGSPNGEIRIQKYEPSGAPAGSIKVSVPGGAGNITGLAVDSDGDIYVATGGTTGAVRKISPAGAVVAEINPSFNNNAIAIGSDNSLFVSDATGELGTGPMPKVFQYSSALSLFRTFYGPFERVVLGMFPYATTDGDIFTAELNPSAGSGVWHVKFPPLGPVIYPREVVASKVSNTKATLNAKVNPEGKETTYHFEYITEADYLAAGETFGAGTVKTPETSLGSQDFIQHPVSANITGLMAETVYYFRVVASNADGSGRTGLPGTFTTKEPLELGDAWSSDVGTSTATLNGEVNPLGIPATARFEYLELSEWEDTGWANAKTVPTGEEIDLGAGEEMVRASAQVSGLEPGIAYRFRIVATDRCKPEPAPLCMFTDPESEGTFTSFLPVSPLTGCPNDALRVAGSGEFLPDCRGYEMVSPVDKNGAFIEPVFNINGFPAGLDQAAINGDSVTFSAYKAFGEVDSAPYTNQYLSRRGSGGWATEGISPEREDPSLLTYESAYLDRQYKAFSSDLCSGWVVQDAVPTLAPGAPEDFPGLYRRNNCDPGTGSYEALTTVQPPSLPPSKFMPEFQGASADGSVEIFVVHDNLVAGIPDQPLACRNETDPGAETCESRLYEKRGGQLRYACILPNGSPYGGKCSAGTPAGDRTGRTNNVNNAISEDGSRIFWSASGTGPGALYVRIDNSLPSAKTIEISSSANPAQFWSAAADGSKAIYSVGNNLFEYDVDGEAETLVAEGFMGVAGVSEEASRVYFASSKVLTEEEENSAGDKAEAGEPNLYLYEAGAGAGAGFSFIGTLADSDLLSGTQPSSPVAHRPIARLSRVTPDGQSIAFMSSAGLTGYDNADAATPGKVAMMVFLYDAEANGGEGAILCPSCNPSGARPEGRQLTQKLLESRWAAARIPTYQSQLYGSRVISEDGNRLYFNSFEALVATDVNDEEDVYQWEAPGTGTCTVEDPTYHASNGGCVDLISSGQSPQGSELVDISSDGADVFFKTNESLVSQDPGLRDIYDARVEGGFPPLPPKPVICQGESCLEQPKAPPAYVTPSSPAAGPGNPVWPKPKPRKKKCRKGTHKVKTKAGKVRCVKNKKKGRADNNRRASR